MTDQERLEFFMSLPPNPAPYDSRGTGAQFLEPSPKDYRLEAVPEVKAVLDVGAPPSAELSQWIGGVYNQGALPSCVAHSTCGMKSIEDNIEHRSWFTYDAVGLYQANGGTGANGVDTRQVLQYALDTGCLNQGNGKRYKIGSYAFAPRSPGQFEETIKAAIAASRPCVVALLLPQNFGAESSGNPTQAYHQVVIYGYDATWAYILNSWGPAWANGGRGKVRWDYLTQQNFLNGYNYAFAVVDALDEGSPSPQPEPQPSPDFTTEMIRLVQQVRAQNGLPALNVHPALMKAAGDYAKEMGVTANYAHNSKDGSTPWQRMQRAGYTGNGTWGENIAAGEDNPSATTPLLCSSGGVFSNRLEHDGYPRPSGSFTDWMNSPGHKGNILNPAFTDIGVGYANVPGSPYTHYWCQDFGVSSAGPQPQPDPQPQPEPVTLRIDNVIGTKQVASARAGETYRVTGQGFGAGVIQARIDAVNCTSSVQNDGLLIVTAPAGTARIGTLFIRREGVEAAGPLVVIDGGSPEPNPQPNPNPEPNPNPDPNPNPTPGELDIKLLPPTRLARARVQLTGGITYLGAGVLATVKVSAGGQALGTSQTPSPGLLRLIVPATVGTVLLVEATDTAGHRGAVTVTV